MEEQENGRGRVGAPDPPIDTHLQRVLDTIPALIVIARLDGSLEFVNQRWVDFTGFPSEALVGTGWHTVLHPEDLAHFVEEWAAARAAGQPFENETRIRRADGEFHWFRIHKSPLRNERREIIRWYGSGHDIEALRRVEADLERDKVYLMEAQRLSHTGCFSWNVSTGEVFCMSEETLRIFGYDPTIQPTMELALNRIHPQDLAMFRTRSGLAVREAMPLDLEHRLLMPDGTIKHVHVAAHPLRFEGGVELVGAITDTTAQHEAREALERALEEVRGLRDQLHNENLALREELDHAFAFDEIIGSSPAVKRVLAHIARVAPTDSTVLITGETGTGKELVARAIHKRSTRVDQPFVAVNCAVIPPALVAAELFGHEKGAFTGASQRRLGRFEIASNGTLFLDEVGDLPMETQVALLRVLEEHTIERVGGSQLIPVDVRVLAATNRDLSEMVEAGTFRQDLYYRLNVFPIEVPPLRERREDIAPLVEYLAGRYARKASRGSAGTRCRCCTITIGPETFVSFRMSSSGL